MNWLTELEGLKLPALQSGAHKNPGDGLCAMELVAFIERLPHSDAPPCTCPVIGAYTRRLNDLCTDAERQRLLPILPRLVGTVSPEHEIERARFIALYCIREIVPIVLDGRIDAKIVARMRKADNLADGKDVAYAAACAAANAAADAAADAAAYAAANAAANAAAKRSAIIDAAFAGLEGMLAIGPQGRWSAAPEQMRERLFDRALAQ